ncbi:MAG: SLC13 family permease [Acidobacteriota bacterium]|nr:SLC13 family permease [Acidobacteriota bacterium]
MTLDKVLFIGIVCLAMYLYISQRLSVITTALVTIVGLTVCNILSLDEALQGFSSPATVSIGGMFILSAGLIKTGALEPLTKKLAAFSGGSYTRLIIAMAAFIPLASAFTNNTPIVVMMVPVLMSLGRELGIPPSKLLMPLSFLAILGGTCTLIGTSTNLLIDEFYRQETGLHLGIFEFTPLGLIVLTVGGAFLIISGQRWLPKRDSLTAILPPNKRSSYVTEVVVQEDSPLIGKVIKDVFPKNGRMRFLQLMRMGDVQYKAHAENEVIQNHDALILEGNPEALNDLINEQQVALGTVLEDSVRVPIMRTYSQTLFELVVLPDSPLVGNKVSQLRLHTIYGVKVLAVQRGGRHHRLDIRGMRIKSGDMFLVQGETQAMHVLRDSSDFLVIEEVDKTIPKREKSKWAVGVMLAVILLTALTPIPLAVWALAGVVCLIVVRCLGTDDCIAALDFNVLFLLIGTIPLGTAFKNTGLTEDVAHFLVEVVGANHPLMLVSALYLITNVLTSLISNAAVAALMTPLAIGLAHELGVDAKPLIMTVAYAASAAFATPIAYQTNIIVMGPGGYTFKDYLKYGVPLSLLIWIVVSLMIPVIWPLK